MSKKIMVVDDEESLLALVGAILKKEGFSVTTAASGQEALDKIEKDVPDLVVLDMMMPGMSGRETAEKIRANPKTKKIKLIFLTVAKFSETGKDILSKMDVKDYITKPFENQDLVNRIKKILA